MDGKTLKIKKKLEKKLLKTPGVVGVGYDGEHFIVYVEDESVDVRMQSFSGVPIKTVVSGRMYALNSFFRPQGNGTREDTKITPN